MVGVDPSERHPLLVIPARLHPLMRFEYAIVGMIIRQSDIVLPCEWLEGFLAFNHLIG